MGIALGTVSSAIAASSAQSTFSWAHAVVGPEDILIGAIAYETTKSGALAITEVRWGTTVGTTFTLRQRISRGYASSAQLVVEVWTLSDPSTGSTLVHVVFNNSSHNTPPVGHRLSLMGTTGIGNSSGAHAGAASSFLSSILLSTPYSWHIAAWAGLSTASSEAWVAHAGSTILAQALQSSLSGGIGMRYAGTSGMSTFGSSRSVAGHIARASIEVLARDVLSPGQWRHAHGIGSVTPI